VVGFSSERSVVNMIPERVATEGGKAAMIGAESLPPGA
jgi:hypothetical protein